MSDQPDLRAITRTIEDALSEYEPDVLRAMLSHLFREYVVEGPPPMLVHQTEQIADLDNLSFAQLITALQTRLALPELSLFQVDGEQVSVRVGGVLTPLTAPRGPLGAEVPPGGAGAGDASLRAIGAPRVAGVTGVTVGETVRPAPTGRASVDEAMARGRGDLAGVARHGPAAASEAPPPRRGVSIRGRAGGAVQGGNIPEANANSAPRGAAEGQPTQAPPGAGQGQSPAGQTQPEPPADDDIASTRFSLLELD